MDFVRQEELSLFTRMPVQPSPGIPLLNKIQFLRALRQEDEDGRAGQHPIGRRGERFKDISSHGLRGKVGDRRVRVLAHATAEEKNLCAGLLLRQVKPDLGGRLGVEVSKLLVGGEVPEVEAQVPPGGQQEYAT